MIIEEERQNGYIDPETGEGYLGEITIYGNPLAQLRAELNKLHSIFPSLCGGFSEILNEEEKYYTVALMSEHSTMTSKDAKYVLDYLTAQVDKPSFSSMKKIINKQLESYHGTTSGTNNLNRATADVDAWLAGKPVQAHVAIVVDVVKEYINNGYDAKSGFNFVIDHDGQFRVMGKSTDTRSTALGGIYPVDRPRYTDSIGTVYEHFTAKYLTRSDHFYFWNISLTVNRTP